MNDTPILKTQWPDDLNPATVPFLTRNVTILCRAGFFDDWALFNTLTESQVLSCTTAKKLRFLLSRFVDAFGETIGHL